MVENKKDKNTKKDKQPNIDIELETSNNMGKLVDMDDAALGIFIAARYSDMKSSPIRETHSKYRDEADKQFTALTIYDKKGDLNISIPMEQNLIDAYEGRSSGKYNFDIQADGKQADVTETQPAKYSLEYYLEGGPNRGNGFYDEAPSMRRLKARYGTVFAFTGIENKSNVQYRIKEDAEINSPSDLEDMENYESYKVDTYEFFPHGIKIRDIFIDEKALNQPNLQKADDIIIEKIISIDRLKLLRGDKNSYKHIDDIKEATPEDGRNSENANKNEAVIRFYFNILTKDYIIQDAGNNNILHRSKMIYNHGEFPIESCQHYADDNCIYGIGTPRKIKYIKGAKSELMQSLLDNAAMTSGLNFVIGNDGELEDFNIGGRGINARRTSTGAENIRPIQPQVNSGLISMLNILDDLVVQDTGENVRASIEAQSDKVGIVEIMEENKAIRHKSVDESWNLFLDKVLTQMLNNIAQFVPSLMSKTYTAEVKTKKGGKEVIEKVNKIEFPYVKVKNATVKQKGDKIEIDTVENYGKEGYFEMKPGTIAPGLGVKVVTPSSHSSLPLIRKENFDKWLEQKLKMANLAQMDPTGSAITKMFENISMTEINDWMNDTFGFEDKLKADTGKDKQRRANLEKLKKLKEKTEVLNNKNIPNAGNMQDIRQNPTQNGAAKATQAQGGAGSIQV